MIRVLVAEGSVTASALLVHILRSDPEIGVIGTAKDGLQAVEMAERLRPDIITMGLRMPRLDGLEATRTIMARCPTPIVVVSGNTQVGEAKFTMDVLHAGALAVLPKIVSPAVPTYEEEARNLLSSVKEMSQLKVVRRLPKKTLREVEPASVPRRDAELAAAEIVAIATSAGGPAVLHDLFSNLSGDFPVPIVVVQHMSPGFMQGCAEWLDTSSRLHVKLAEEGETLASRTVYLAPDDKHLGVSNSLRVQLSDAPRIGRFRPSGTFLFRSIAEVFGDSTLAVIMTGMGDDGLEGLRAVRAAGGTIIAQDEKSSIVFGMPNAAIEAGLADNVVPLQFLGSYLSDNVRRKT